MAKTKTTGTKKLSRREMVVLLGSGAFLAASEEPAKAQGPGACRVVSPNKGSGKGNHMVLSGDPCCKDSLAVFLNGMTTKISPSAKTNLKPLADALRANQKNLLEYSVMIWGLKEEDRDAIMKIYQERFALRSY